MKTDFVFRMPSKIIFGVGRFNLLKEEVDLLAKKGRVLVVLDPQLRQRILSRTEKLLTGRKIDIWEIKDGEPTVQSVDEVAEYARRLKPTVVIGIGGGSAMDTAKAVSALLTHPGSSQRYRGQNLLVNPTVPKIMIPTTAGTGSEITQTAVLIHQGRKGGINSPYLIPEAAILDPELLITLPPAVTTSTGLDALTHAVESYLSKNSSPLTESLSLSAAELMVNWLPKAIKEGRDIEARTFTLMGSLLAGIALGNAGVIAGHSLSYPLGARFHLPHGIANGMLLPYVMAEISDAAPEKLARLSKVFGINKGDKDLKEQAKEAVNFIFEFERKIGFTKRLSDFGIPKEMLSQMVTEAQAVSVPIANTPKPLTACDLLRIYQNAY